MRYPQFRLSRAVPLIIVVAVCAASNLSAQFQPQGALGALAPANIAKPRPKPPFDLTGTWLHGGGEDGFRFAPPPGFKLTPEAQVIYDESRKAQAEGKVYHDDIGQCWPSGLPITDDPRVADRHDPASDGGLYGPGIDEHHALHLSRRPAAYRPGYRRAQLQWRVHRPLGKGCAGRRYQILRRRSSLDRLRNTAPATPCTSSSASA